MSSGQKEIFGYTPMGDPIKTLRAKIRYSMCRISKMISDKFEKVEIGYMRHYQDCDHDVCIFHRTHNDPRDNSHSYTDLHGNSYQCCMCCKYHQSLCIVCDKPALRSCSADAAIISPTLHANAQKFPQKNAYLLTCSQKCQRIVDAPKCIIDDCDWPAWFNIHENSYSKTCSKTCAHKLGT